MNKKEELTVREFSEATGSSAPVIYKACEHGEIEARMVNGRWLIRAEEKTKWNHGTHKDTTNKEAKRKESINNTALKLGLDPLAGNEITVNAAAALTDYSPKTFVKYIKAGKLKGRQIGRWYVVDEDAALNFVAGTAPRCPHTRKKQKELAKLHDGGLDLVETTEPTVPEFNSYAGFELFREPKIATITGYAHGKLVLKSKDCGEKDFLQTAEFAQPILLTEVTVKKLRKEIGEPETWSGVKVVLETAEKVTDGGGVARWVQVDPMIQLDDEPEKAPETARNDTQGAPETDNPLQDVIKDMIAAAELPDIIAQPDLEFHDIDMVAETLIETAWKLIGSAAEMLIRAGYRLRVAEDEREVQA